MTVALITGSNSGIGRGAAIRLARAGWEVHASMRNLAKADKLLAEADQAGVTVHTVELDIADEGSIRRAVDEVTERSGGVDVLVNNAGVGGNAVTEEAPIALYESVMDTNLYGAIRCIQAVLPQMRERRNGVIVNISSLVGKVCHIGQSPYYVSKWALEGMSEGLAHEVAPFGIRAAIVEPGITRSAIFAKNTDAPNSSGAYDAQYRRLFQFYAAGIPQGSPPEEVGEVILHAATTDDPKLRYVCSWGGTELIGGRAAMSDEDWVGLGACEDDADYYARFEDLFGLDIRPR